MQGEGDLGKEAAEERFMGERGGEEEGQRAFLKAKWSAVSRLHMLVCTENWQKGVVGISRFLFDI